jgi:Tfp pilus assembly protein PilF
LKNVRKNYERAEELLERAIQADPQNAKFIGNYANFLTSIRKEHDRAELLYERAVQPL